MILPLLLFGFAACQPAAVQLTDAEKATIAEEVNAINTGFWDAWRDADFGRGMSYYYDSPDLAFAMQGVVDYGYAPVDEKYRPGMENVASQTITLTDSRTTVLAADVVCIMDAGSYTATDAVGVTGPETGFAVTNLWVLRDGEWKIHVGHESFATPAAESM
jgi:ketosteroid isomerase-like protein